MSYLLVFLSRRCGLLGAEIFRDVRVMPIRDLAEAGRVTLPTACLGWRCRCWEGVAFLV
jgi:hypothetical protein